MNEIGILDIRLRDGKGIWIYRLIPFSDYPNLRDTQWTPAPTEVVKHGRFIDGDYTYHKYPYAVHASSILKDASFNASYLRIEAERHPKHDVRVDYPGFVEHDTMGARFLVGRNIKESTATQALWLKDFHPQDTANALQLVLARDNAGVFNDSLWHYNYLSEDDEPAEFPGRPGDSNYYMWHRGKVGLKRLLIRFRVRLDTDAVWTDASAPPVFSAEFVDQYGVTRAIDTFYAGSDFKHRGLNYDTVSLRFTPIKEQRKLRVYLRWFGQVSMTMDWLEVMTGKVDSLDYLRIATQPSWIDTLDAWSGAEGIPSHTTFSAEDILVDTTRFTAFLDSLIGTYNDNVAYWELHEEAAIAQMYPMKRVAKMLRDRTAGKMELLMIMHDSSDQAKYPIPNYFLFYNEGVMRGWLDSTQFADPAVFVVDPYQITDKVPLPRRMSSDDTTILFPWSDRYIAVAQMDGHTFAKHYSRSNYRLMVNQEMKVLYDVLRGAYRSIQRYPGRRFGMAVEAGATPAWESNLDHFYFVGGGRPPTGAEFKLMANLGVSMGATFLTPYTLLNGFGHTQTGNGGLMDWNADHSSNLILHCDTVKSNGWTVDFTEQYVWMGFKERFDTARTLFPRLRHYGDTLMHSSFLREFKAHQYNNPNLLPFVANSIRSYDSLGVRDDFSEVDSINQTDVHVSVWRHSSGDTLLYITNTRTDDSYVPGDTICGRQDCRFISMRMKRECLVNDILDTSLNRAVGKIRTPYVGAGDSLVVWLTPGEGVLVRLTAPPSEPMKQMKMAVSFPKPSSSVKDYYAHGGMQLNRPLAGVQDRFYPDSTKWTVPSSIHSYVGIADDDSVMLHQDSLLYQSFASSRPEKWRQQNWTEKAIGGDDFKFSFKKTVPPSNQRAAQLSTDSIAHSISINTDLESRYTNGVIKFWDPFYVRYPSFVNESDTLEKTTPFLPHVLQGSVPGADGQGYGGVFFRQDSIHSGDFPNYALSAYPTIRYTGGAGTDSMPGYVDWSFLQWYRDDGVYPSTYHWSDTSITNDAFFSKEGATYTARYKSHMTSYIGGNGTSAEIDTGFEGNNQRKLVYLYADSADNRWYQVVWSSLGRLYTARGWHPLDNHWITWGREELLTPWEDTAATYPSIVLHRGNRWGQTERDTTLSVAYQTYYPETGDRGIRYLSYLGHLADIDPIVYRESTETNAPKPLATPAMAGADLHEGEVDVIAYAAEDGIRVIAVNRAHPEHVSSELRFGNSSSLYPTIWANERLDGDTSYVYLAWEQKGYDPVRTSAADTVSDIFNLRFKVALPGAYSAPTLTLFTDGTSDSMNVSKEVGPPSYDNHKPCISGNWRWLDTVITYIAYETMEAQLVPHFPMTTPPTFDTNFVDGIAVSMRVWPWQYSFLNWVRPRIHTGTANHYTRPSIEATRFQRTDTLLYAKNFWYSLAFELNGGHDLVHYAIDWTTERLTPSVFTNNHRPQLAVVYDKVDVNNYRVSQSADGEPRWIVHQFDHLFKIGASDTLFGYRSISESDTSGLTMTYAFGEVRTDDGATQTDYEHVATQGDERIDSVHTPEKMMQSERIVLPAHGALSYYSWVYASNDSLFKANYDQVNYALSFYDSNGALQFDLDSLIVVDTMTSLRPSLRTVTLDLDHALSGMVRLRRLSDRSTGYENTTWTDRINLGRLSTAASQKRISGGRGKQEQASITTVPNPFMSRTLVTFGLPAESIVDLDIYDIKGDKVRSLLNNAHYRAGEHQIFWTADNLPNGIYLVKLRYNNKLVSCRSIYMR